MPPIVSPPSTGRDGRENNSLLTIVKAQIVFLMSTLTEDNFERNQAEIRTLSETHGIETYLHFIRRLIVASQQRLAPSASPYDNNSALTFRLLVQEVQRLARDPFLADRFRDGIDRAEGEVFRHFDLLRFMDRIGLRPLEKLIIASSIVSTNNTRKELAAQANQIIRLEWTNAVLSLCTRPSFDHADLTPSQVAKLLSNLLSDPPSDMPVLDTQQRHEILVAAWSKYGQDVMSPILQQILPSLSLPPGTSLVQALNQLGPDLTCDPDVIRAMLLRFGVSDAAPPQTKQVVEILATMARSALEGKQLCDVAALTRALGTFRPPLHWPTIIRALDEPERTGVDTATLKLTIAVLLNAPRDVEAHAVSGFWSIWNNTTWQVKLLDSLLSLPGDTFNFVTLPGRRTVTVDDVAGASPTIKALAANVQGHTWNSLDLIETLVKLGDSDVTDTKTCVRELLDKGVRISAELVHMGLLQVPKPWGQTQREYSDKLLAMFLAGHPNHQLVFMRIWQIDQSYLTSAFRQFYEDSPLNITRILDVAQDLKILEALLDVRPFTFALDVAALASRREYLNLDKWLADNVNAHGVEFLRSVIDFLDIKVNNAQDASSESRTMALNPSTIVIIIRTLRTNATLMTPDDIAFFHEVRNRCCQLYPRLMNLMPGSDVEPGLSIASFSSEIETEVETIYKQMYDEQISVEQVIALLQRASKSPNPRDHEVFACTLHSLFDEYKFFNSSYPPRELQITAHFFGSLIQYELINSTPLGIAVRFVLDALRYPPDANLFKFGVTALAKFESRLYKWPDLCRTLLALPNLQEARPDLIDTAQRIVAQADAGQLGPNGSVLGDVDQLPLPFQSIRPDSVTDPIEEPEDEQTDKILFIINNLAPSNFEQKAAEMKERFKDEHARWLANYLVDQRVSTEPNNHELYLRLLDSLQRKPVFRFVLHETFVKAANLLNSDQTLSSATDRTVLKNLASWLGALTLARDRPIKHKNISFKDLLLEGYDNNRLLVAIPFVCKILEHGKNSLVFRPPNPWLMGVISLLAELYHFAELRLNDKFEIEVTCRALDIELDKVEATTILRNRPMTDPMQAPQLPDYVHDIDSMPMGTYDATQPPAQQTILPAQMTSSSPSPQVSVAIEAILNGLPAMVVVNPQLGPYAANPAFKRACQMAVDHAVREIIMPVIERSVTIAGISTRELVTKDYALEVNEEKMRKAAQLMAQNLAGNLAMVTCKEPLRSNMITHLRLMLTEHGFGENIPDQAIQLIVNDNVDIACTVIEKAAMDRAAAEVEDAFTDAYNARRNHRETRPNQPFWDTSSQLSPFLATLPDVLRIKPTGLQQQQTRVYDEFGREGARVAISRPGSVNVMRDGYGASTTASEALGAWSHQLCMDRFTQLAAEAERVMAAHGLSQNDAQNFIRQVIQFAGKSPDPDQTTLAYSQKTVQLMFKTELQVARELYALLLAKMCEVWPKVAKEAIDWLLYAEDPRKFNVPVTLTLIRLRVIAAPDYDLPLSKQVVANMTGPVVAFAVSLLREAIFGDQPCATRNHFANTIEALGRTVTANKSTPEILRLLEDVGVRRPAPADNDVYETLLHHFAEWVRIYQRAPSSEKAFVSWVTQVTAQGILRGEDLSSLFYRVCVESSIQMYNKCIASGEPILAFQPIDALARLIVLMIKYNGDASSTNSVPTKVHYLSKILSIVVLVLARAHEDDTVEFKQRPFFRLFSSLLADLHSIESQLHVAYFPLLIAICDTFNTLQPIFFPGFAFSWMSLISHRLFLPKLLLTENRDGWSAFHRLLLSLFRFLSPFLKNASMHNAVGTLYRGSLSVLLVLLHDFPEFLTEYYFTLCDAVPPRCIQLRNIILSAYPPQLQIPDPYPRDLKLDSLPDMGPIPAILSDFTSSLSPEIRNLLDAQLMGRGNTANTLTLIKQAIVLPGNLSDDGSTERYNIHVMNAVVMFVGVSSVAQAKARTGSSLFVGTDPGVVLLQQLASELDAEGQHHLIGSFGIHLRYPNAHTHWFSSLVLHLFKEINAGKYQEITTKVLFERFLVHRPHPWGLIVTFIELLRNSRYDFWNKEFLGVSPEITDLLKHVSRSL